MLIKSFVILVCIALSVLAASHQSRTRSQTIFVDNSFKSRGDGTKNSPYSTLESALEHLATTYDQRESNSFKIVLSKTDSSYIFPAIDISNLENLSLKIESKTTNPTDLNFEVCKELPRIHFAAHSNITFSSLASLTLHSLFIRGAINGISTMNILNTSRFSVINSCFDENFEVAMEAEGLYVISTSNVSQIQFDSVLIHRNNHQNIFLRAANSKSFSFLNSRIQFFEQYVTNQAASYNNPYTCDVGSGLFKIDSKEVILSNMSLLTSETPPKGCILCLRSQSVSLNNTFFSDNTIEGTDFLRGIISIDWAKPSAVLSLSISKSHFRFNAMTKASIFSVIPSTAPRKLSFYMKGNNIESYSMQSSWTLMDLQNLILEDFELSDNTLVLRNNIPNGKFIQINNCTGSATIMKTQIFIGGINKFTFMPIRSSPNLTLDIVKFRVFGNQYESNSIYIIDSDSGSMNLEAFEMKAAAIATPVVKLSSIGEKIKFTLVKSKFMDLIQTGLKWQDEFDGFTLGGLIYAENWDASWPRTPLIHISVSSCTFDNIETDASGGIINILNDVTRGPVVVNIDGTEFKNIRAVQGAVVKIYSTENSDHIDSPLLEVKMSYFANNSATKRGGAMFLRATRVNITNSLFENNTASHGGPGVYFINSTGWKSLLKDNETITLEEQDIGMDPSEFDITLEYNDSVDNGAFLSYEEKKWTLENVTATTSLQSLSFQIQLKDELNRKVIDYSDSRNLEMRLKSAMEIQSFRNVSCNNSMCVASDDQILIQGVPAEIEMKYTSQYYNLSSIIDIKFA